MPRFDFFKGTFSNSDDGGSSINAASGKGAYSVNERPPLSQQLEDVSKGLIGCGCLTVLLFVFFAVIAAPKLEKNWQQQDHSVDALSVSRMLVKQKLLAPASAKFPSAVFDGAIGHVHRQGQTYRIESYVDSQNVFGAMLRTRYKVTLKRIGPDIDDFEIQEVELFDP